jgi:hypothetical protein
MPEPTHIILLIHNGEVVFGGSATLSDAQVQELIAVLKGEK